MIEINIQMPEKCGLCPCFHHDNPMYCQAVKADKNKKIVSPYGSPRPEWCPMKEQEAEARLLTAEEVQNMEAGTAFGIETYYDHDGERMPGCAWALRTERLILSFFGTMFPDTVTKIPYNTLEMNQNTGKHEKHQYRFWSKKPTFEQCKAVKWE